jgi:hypothetical protein
LVTGFAAAVVAVRRPGDEGATAGDVAWLAEGYRRARPDEASAAVAEALLPGGPPGHFAASGDLRARIRADYREGRVVTVHGGWIVSETEGRLAVAVAG